MRLGGQIRVDPKKPAIFPTLYLCLLLPGSLISGQQQVFSARVMSYIFFVVFWLTWRNLDYALEIRVGLPKCYRLKLMINPWSWWGRKNKDFVFATKNKLSRFETVTLFFSLYLIVYFFFLHKIYLRIILDPSQRSRKRPLVEVTRPVCPPGRCKTDLSHILRLLLVLRCSNDLEFDSMTLIA